MNSGKHRLGRLFAAACIVVWLGAWVGCGSGSGTVTVEGNVTFDGKPVEEGSIVFEPTDGEGTSGGGTIENGKYKLAGEAGVMPGKKTVRIIATRKTGGKVHPFAGTDTTEMVDEVEQYIPATYNTESTLTCEVTSGGANQHDFDLKSK